MLTVHDVYFTLPGMQFDQTGVASWNIRRNQFTVPDSALESLYQPPIGPDMNPAFAAATADYLVAYRYVLAAGSWRLIVAESNYPIQGFSPIPSAGGNPLYLRRF